MASIEVLDTGVVFRNPKPHLRSVHAWFPWVTTLPSGELLCSFQIASAFEAADAYCGLARSSDGGTTWTYQGKLHDDAGPGYPTCEALKTTADAEGNLIAFGTRFDRSDPEAAICNEETGGILPMEVVALFSGDEGHTWSAPEVVDTHIGGSFEAQAPVVVLSDGRWITPLSTWTNWDGSNPNGDKTIALISEDKGRTWPGIATVFDDPEDKLLFWEVRIIEMEPGRLLAVGWAHDKTVAEDIDNQFSISEDGGRTWRPFKSAGFHGQSCCPVYLGDGRILFTYNQRYGEPGVRARISSLQADELVEETETTIFGVHAAPSSSQRQADKMMVHEMSSFKFGQPSPHLMADGTVLAVHWCVVDCVGEIRWTRLKVS